ncbi:MAG: hypothetical protein Q9160_000351 [Pyrenula sp. 1 TL-2023]
MIRLVSPTLADEWVPTYVTNSHSQKLRHLIALRCFFQQTRHLIMIFPFPFSLPFPLPFQSKSSLRQRLRTSSNRTKVALVAASLLLLWVLFPSTRQPLLVDPTYGLIKETSESSRFAIATFLTGGSQGSTNTGDSDSDHYFTATRVLTYQLLHDPETRCYGSVEFIVLVTPNVSQKARQQLKADGAVVTEATQVPLRWWIKTGVTRWKDQFMKLCLLNMTQYDRILFIDADTLVKSRLDGIFDDLEVRQPVQTLMSQQKKTDEAPLPAQFMFAARSNNELTGRRDHPFPPLKTRVFSAGFWIAAPSQELFAYLMSVMQHFRRFNPHTMEQSLLNYAFRRDGPMPWTEIHYKWSATWPSHRDVEGQVATLHEKFWATGPKELQDMWWEQKRKMEQYYAQRARSPNVDG